ncbi:LptA/OstA family protein [Pelorhabdus rhamnosifermentans]|uniref:LptA/OstA family protein n=1 Tax=Pelorhabdus rhamnosifermentans TaxID=2772457 RepID=UPI001C061293|nr:LptA/OstA family protein [Pelorhabdus rhamnosifermentans]
MIKKITLLMLLLCVLLTSTALAKPIITADKTYFDVATGLYNLVGNVYIEVGNRIITAGQAKVNMASMEVSGSGGITVTQDDIKFSGDNVFVYGTASKAEVNGNIIFVRSGLSITSDQATFNWKTKQAVFTGNVQVIQGNDSKTYNSVTYDIVANIVTPDSDSSQK